MAAAVPSAPDDVVVEPSEFSPSTAGPIGAFRVVDRKPGASHVLTFVSGTGDTDNLKFAISGANLFRWLFDFATLPSGTALSIRVRATDASDATRFVERALTLRTFQPHPPTSLQLDVSSLSDRARAGALVARISVADPDPGDTAALALVAGGGDADNGLFTLTGVELRLARALAAGRQSATFRLRATDSTGLKREENFTLPIASQRLRINEILAGSLGGVKDEHAVLQEWVEIANPLPQYEDLTGWFLTDDAANLMRWKFPQRTVAPGGFVVVLADGLRTAPAGSSLLHVDFSLSADGEWIGLVQPDGVTLADTLAFPRQYPGVAFGLGSEGRTGYLPTPTPGAANGAGVDGGENTITFSRAHGFFTNSFTIELAAKLPGSAIRYTTDGTIPTPSTGLPYSGPINVTPNTTGFTRGTRIIRAVAFNAAAAYSPVGTQTYLFVNGVAGPATDGIVSQTRLATSITRHAVYKNILPEALVALPVVSVTMANGPGSVERPASIELFDPGDREPGFQINCGISATGTTSLGSPKLSMAARFHSGYGPPRLRYPLFAHGSRFPERAADNFKEIRLRSHSHDTFFWLATRENPSVPYGNPAITRSGDAQLARNPWIDEMQLAMGQPGKHGRQVNLYLNGSYHGIYHLHEHADEDYMANHFPGSPADYHFTGGGTTGSDHGAGDNWHVPWNSLKASLANYTQARRWVDVTSLCDYMILSFYAGNDWDWSTQHNWSAAGPRLPDRGGWKFFEQDSDIILQDIVADCTDQDAPDGVFTALMKFPDFRVLFRDRVQVHCYGNGMLTPARAGAMYDDRMNEIQTAIVAETARWQPSSSVGTLPWDRDEEWAKEWRYLREIFFPRRTAALIQQFRKHSGWWPFEAPAFSQPGGAVPVGLRLTLSAGTGTVYWTTDGSDPRLPGGRISPSASTQTVNVDRPMLVRARTYSGSDWSAVVEAYYFPEDTPRASAANLVLSEIQYHPMDPPDAEFLEFFNTTEASIDLTDLRITNGITFRFPKATVVAAGSRVVVAKDPAVFEARYAAPTSPYFRAGVHALGPWVGSLSNGGDTLDLVCADGSQAFSVKYGTDGEWPGRADGGGSSLELVEPYAVPLSAGEKSAWLSDPARWRSSVEFHGSPGSAGEEPRPSVVINEVRSSPEPGDSDAIELLNVSADTVYLGGWYLSDSSSEYRKFRIPAVLLMAGARVVFRESDFNNLANPNSLVPFALAETGDDVHLVQGDASGALLRFVDRVGFGPMPRGVSLGRFPDGSGPFARLQQPSFEETNGLPVAGYAAWAATAFKRGTEPGLILAEADPDADGLSNFAEYAFVLDPSKADGPPLLARSDGSGWLQLSYRVRTYAPDLDYLLESSSDLGRWAPVQAEAVEVGRAPHGDGSTAVKVRISLNGPPGPAGAVGRFVRVRVTPR